VIVAVPSEGKGHAFESCRARQRPPIALGGHMPTDALSYGFFRLYDSYERIVAEFSDDERDDMFRRTALNWFQVPAP
jgi:hypothetical protein